MIGEVVTLINRQPVQVTVTTLENATAIEFGESLSLSLITQTLDGKPLKPSADGVINVVKGGFIEASGGGFKSGTPVEAWLYSDPVRLGDGTALADGSFQNKFPISSAVPLGKHTIVLNGLTPENEIFTVALGVRVIENADAVAPEIPTASGPTEQDNLTKLISQIGTMAFAAVVLAILFLAIRRRRTGN